jgi:hypothetical protein
MSTTEFVPNDNENARISDAPVVGGSCPETRQVPGVPIDDAKTVDAAPNRFYLPSSKYRIVWAAQRIFAKLAEMFAMFVHAGVVVEIAFRGKDHAELRDVSPSMFRSRAEVVGELFVDGIEQGKHVCREKRCSEDQAKALLATREALELLPPITAITGAPVLTIDASGKWRLLKKGYHSELGGIFVRTNTVDDDVSLADAVDTLTNLLIDYRFQTDSDKARAIAAMLTPAMVYGQLLDEAHGPMILIEANKSQAGKGLLLEIIAALYGERPKIVVSRNGGVGSSDEDFNSSLLRGCPMIMWDNLRGELNSPHLEAFLTAGGPFMVRGFRRAPVDVDPQRYIVLATSNGFKPTEDLENRMIKIRIFRRKEGYQFNLYNEELLDLIRSRQRYYLGCVFSILREWIDQGRPRTGEMRHTFRAWAQSMDWILSNLCKRKIKGRLMDYPEADAANKADLAGEYGMDGSDV